MLAFSGDVAEEVPSAAMQLIGPAPIGGADGRAGGVTVFGAFVVGDDLHFSQGNLELVA